MTVLMEVFRNTMMITSFVVIIMLFIELLNVFTKGAWSHRLKPNKPLQVLIATLLGLIPGCFGGFAVVSLWTHGSFSFGALVAAMISGIGDEAFVMLVRMPNQALFLMGILLLLSLFVGWLVDKLKITVALPQRMNEHLIIHEHETVQLSTCLKHWRKNFQPISFTRVLLITGLLLILLSMITGSFEHEHQTTSVLFLDESWFNGLFIVLGLLVLFTFFIVDDHFLDDHLWKHIIKQHVPRIALWTFAALLMIHFLMDSVDLQTWVQTNVYWMLLVAVLVGLIPESGPHIVFITLFLSGAIPFSLLLANSITQDGHASLPLLAESKRGFIGVKLINAVVGLIVGGIGLLVGF